MTIAGICIGPKVLRGPRAAEIPKDWKTEGRGVPFQTGLSPQRRQVIRREAAPVLQESPDIRREAGLLREEGHSLTDIPENPEKAGRAGVREADAAAIKTKMPGIEAWEMHREAKQRQEIQERNGMSASRPNPEGRENRPEGRNLGGSLCLASCWGLRL